MDRFGRPIGEEGAKALAEAKLDQLKKAREANLKPIFCIGETLAERESGKLEEVLGRQITKGLDGLTEKDMLDTVIAYEPVWAIGTGVTATTGQAQEAHAFVRGEVAKLFGDAVANKVRIQYGGSVKPGNAASAAVAARPIPVSSIPPHQTGRPRSRHRSWIRRARM